MCIGDTYLIKYTPKYRNPMIKINRITCGCETFISAMFLSSDLNIWWLTQLAKLDQLYINNESTSILQISNIYYI